MFIDDEEEVSETKQEDGQDVQEDDREGKVEDEEEVFQEDTGDKEARSTLNTET